MSAVDPALPDQVTRVVTETLPRLGADTPAETLLGLAVLPVQFVSFWTATLLPFAYLPMLATGVVQRHPVAFAALLGVNLLAFVVGHGYKRDARPA